ncbi:MAG: sulfotransferase [Alphaproteobacteria bacterium]|nr:sulfotransferase [Alphaproteobacteria bacterium]
MSTSTLPAPAKAQVTVSRTSYRPVVRAIDLLAGVAGLLPTVAEIAPDSILASARRRTGLSDFGSDEWREPFERICDVASNMPLSNLARIITRQTFIMAAVNRLKIEDYFRRHPDAADVEIERPVFVLGFPRTGTTLLQNLLSLEPGTRSLKFWELQNPVPASDDPRIDRDKRLAKARATLRAAYFMAPEMDSVHEVGPETAEECWPLFFNAYSVLNYDIAAGFRTYGDWLADFDMRPAYRYYKRQLQMMAHARPTRQFVLKCPEHLWFVDALVDVFPDAHLVWTHRDPFDVVASYCSLISMNRRMLYGAFDPQELGPYIQERFAIGVRRAMAVRDARPDITVIDVGFRQLVADTPGMVRRIRETFDLPHEAGADARIQSWLTNGRKDKRGAHRYSAGMYGLDSDALYAAFQPYIDRFDVPLRQRR